MKKETFSYLSITDILETINKHYGSKPALRAKREDESFRELSYIELGNRTVDVSSALIKLGIKKEDKVAILSENRPEWVISFFAIISCAGITVSIDTKLSKKEIQFILKDSHAKVIFVSKKYFSIIEGLRNILPYLKHVILLDDTPCNNAILLKDLKLKEGDRKYIPVCRDDVSMIVYTSGTLGVAKGVELTYKNLLFQVLSLTDIVHYTPKDEFLSILPLNHMLEVTGGLIAPLYAGACITYSDSLKTKDLLSLMKNTHTTSMICVPIILKMLHDSIMKKINRLSYLQQKIFKVLLAFSKMLLRFNIRIGGLLFRSIHKEFGDKLRCFISGGAPLNINIELDFNALGFRILQGYGLTETAPVVSVNTLRDNRFGSVGRPLPGIEVKILKTNENAKEGEILTRGPHVMKGYFKNPEKTQEVIKDSWLHTGDIGYLDKDNFLHIKGRSKNLIVLGTGKKVYPEEVEEIMKKSPYIKEICVLSKKLHKGYEEVYAVIVPNHSVIASAAPHVIAMAESPKQPLKEIISQEITLLNKSLSPYKRIKDFTIWQEELPKTAAEKIKRQAIVDIVNQQS